MTSRTACILTIGDELLNGDVPNTNATWLGQELRAMGVQCRTMVTVSDRPGDIRESLQYHWQRHDLLVVSGGLGPTRDDVTKKVLLSFFDDVMIRDNSVLEHVTDYFQKKGKVVTEINRRQADVPSRANVLFNDLGTAPGLMFDHENRLLVAMPGVPYELKHITRRKLIPELKKRWQQRERDVKQCYFRTTGIGESDLNEHLLKDLEKMLPHAVEVAFLPHPKGVDLRVTRLNGQPERAFENFLVWIRRNLQNYLYSEDYEQTLAGHIIALLTEKKQQLALAESCTGGYLANELTHIPGSSACFRGGVIAYGNRIKTGLLGVEEATLKKHGAVSAEVALEMARGAGEGMDADYGLSTTGVAGPGGGTGEKPVGTVWIGFWSRTGTHYACRFQLTSERVVNKERSFAVAMDLLRRHICRIPGIPHYQEIVQP